MRKLLILAAATALGASPLSAGIIFMQGSQPGNYPNVHLTPDVGADTTVLGTTGDANAASVIISSADENIVTTTAGGNPSTGNGVTWVGAADKSGINDLTFSLGTGFTFTGIEFNVNTLPGKPVDFFVTLSGTGPDGSDFSTPFATSSNSFFNVKTDDGWKLSSVTFTSSIDVLGVGQIRIGGVEPVITAVPEPASWAMMLIGFGGVGMSMRARKRRNVTPVVAA